MLRWLVLVVAAGSGCIPAPVYKVQRAARVPHPAAPLRSGAPLAAPLELSFGASNALDVRTPRLANRDAAIETERTQVRGELRIRLGKRGELYFHHEHAFAPSPIDRTQAPVPGDHDAWSLGLGFRYALEFPDAPNFFLGLGLGTVTWSIPYVEHRSCVANCEGAPLQQTYTGDDDVGGLAYSLTPTYRSGDLTVFAGLYAAQHPTIVRKGTEIGARDYNSNLDAGPYNYVVHAGLEYKLGPFSLLARVQQDLTHDPVWYGPSFGFAIAGRLFDEYTAPVARKLIEPDDRYY
ncbi:MAG: hypothetical protein ABI678_08125 [Kofleriaceae bacterium]